MGPVLGIESSCDETACAVLAPNGTILAEAVLSQTEHARFGGVVPEIAARAHLTHLPILAVQVMASAGLQYAQLAAIAASAGPGLIGGLIVGTGYARGLALACQRPFIAVNHLEAHALTARLPGLLPGGAPFPYLLLLVSGGHTLLVRVAALGDYTTLGTTIDDAVGEAFDKVGKMLGLGWPGGPALEALAAGGDPHSVALPRPLLGRPGCDFSFSGLKTAVARQLGRARPADLAASFQRAVADVLADRVRHAMQAWPDADARLLVVAGGVAANATVKAALGEATRAENFRLAVPPPRLCTDNAVMVAWAGLERLRAGWVSPLDHAPKPRWPLDAPDLRPA